MNKDNQKRVEKGLPPLYFSPRGELRLEAKEVLESKRGKKLVKRMLDLQRKVQDGKQAID